MTRKVLNRTLLVAASLLLAGSLSGCGNKDEGPKHRSIEGKVTHIDTSTDEVGMLWYDPKDKVEKQVNGTLAPDAEIFINGRTATLEDVKIDDIAEVTGRIEKHDGERKLVAVKVHITRPTDESFETAETATQPG